MKTVAMTYQIVLMFSIAYAGPAFPNFNAIPIAIIPNVTLDTFTKAHPI